MFASLPAASALGASTPWVSVGPEGGDARSFAFDPTHPQHLYLGTLDSWIYESNDGGASWKRLARLGKTDDLVVDNLAVDEADPKTIYAAVWRMTRDGGGIYVSHDAGQSWTSFAGMEGQSVRSFAQAPSNSKILVAGAISGIYRSEDGGEHWAQISPQGSGEIRKVESVAIDPQDPKTIYAGTWHLPWKTTDGGANWKNIKQGVIDDSDVFSIIIDPARPSVVYASACSGIYLSDTGGEVFRKVQGIPSTARRTRVLMQDPVNRNIVYAGTTEGLYKTADGGANWARMTGPDVIINDVYVDPKDDKHVLLATDRSGVLASMDGAATFTASNAGISQRQVTAFLTDAKKPETLYAGVVNDKSYGGVFVSEDGGRTWAQRSQGLDGRDVFSLVQSDDGTIFAGTNHGLFRWDGSTWQQDGMVANTREKTVLVTRHGKREKKTVTEADKPTPIDGQVNSIAVSGTVWFAATSTGVYRSVTQGATWTGPVLNDADYRFVDEHGPVVFAARRNDLRVSDDSGMNWKAVALPAKLTQVQALTTQPDGTLWLGGREGAFFSKDQGQTWEAMTNLPFGNIASVDWNESMKRVVITSLDSTLVFAVDPTEKSWKWWDTGWRVRRVHTMGGRLVAASLYDGIVVQPESSGQTGVLQQATK
ncbi:transcriptional regulator [Silvibacterium dinghuense]|uniref:transcriptional regulator n=1 Tax=Silvibacterium dinghuense TaxID=1560006 RepID=UPI0013E940BD|nr:transcriptional regulator [Silvibacterium dinghuense]